MTTRRRRRFLIAISFLAAITGSALNSDGGFARQDLASGQDRTRPHCRALRRRRRSPLPKVRGRSRRTKRLRPRADDIRAQALDIAAVAAFSVLAFVSFFRKSVRLKYVSLVAAVVYLGFYKSQLISIVNVFGLMGGNLPIFRYNLAWYLLAAITAVSTVLWGAYIAGASAPSARSPSLWMPSFRHDGV